MRKILLFLTLLKVLSASNLPPCNLADTYRKEGIGSLEKRLDNLLTKEEFWSSKIGDYNTTFGWYEKPIYILSCKKSDKTLTLYHLNGNKIDTKIKIPIVVGKVNGDKQRQGDLKTPIGVYKIVQQKRDVDPFYGPFAYVTNYPNPLDKSLGKNGNGIWLHGFPPDCPDKNYTKGCIASPNEDLLRLEKNLPEHKDALIMIAQEDMPTATKKDIVKLLTFIFDWRSDWKYNNLNEYLSKYSSDLKSSIGSFEKFKKHKTYIFSKQQKKEILFYNIKITPYPNALGLKIWRIEMGEKYSSPSFKFVGKKLLYIKQDGDKFKIWREF